MNRSGPLLHVPVQPPRDIKELKLIHKVVESLLTHGPEFEALLMSRPDVQREEKWAWLWDPRSVGGVWYRWRLWQVLTGSQTRRGQGKYLPLFEGSSAWKSPDQPLAFEYTTRLDEFVSDSEYNSSDEDDSGDEGARRQHGGAAPSDPSALADDGTAYLNPLEKAKLTHLLSRLPTTYLVNLSEVASPKEGVGTFLISFDFSADQHLIIFIRIGKHIDCFGPPSRLSNGRSIR